MFNSFLLNTLSIWTWFIIYLKLLYRYKNYIHCVITYNFYYVWKSMLKHYSFKFSSKHIMNLKFEINQKYGSLNISLNIYFFWYDGVRTYYQLLSRNGSPIAEWTIICHLGV